MNSFGADKLEQRNTGCGGGTARHFSVIDPPCSDDGEVVVDRRLTGSCATPRV
ncbi:MAG: hypothetical protein JNK06_14890 [Candidatus Accumulibacter phosphatis]|uniref:hypothetical protein n=1 Tax=Candidatus Accumulibacter phosphatis TaxID=327160 RepID=UPI001A47EEFF|nr:hypothetical protein [Candidatus Accumulibacter phosphatis]